MLNRPKTIRAILFSLGGISCLALTAWIAFLPNIIDNDVVSDSKDQQQSQLDAESALIDRKPVERDLDQTHNLFAANEIDDNIKSTEVAECASRCSSTLSMLNETIEIDDDTFSRLESSIHEISDYLQNNESERHYYLQMAMTTTDGDKRRFLTNIFAQLPDQQRAEIAENFIGSDNWRVRSEGVSLISDHDDLNLEMANTLMDIFSNEESSYIKGNILTNLKQSAILQGDTEILQQLDSALYNETDSSVRVAALNAKMQLSGQPNHVLPDALQALRTSDPELQLAGLIAVEQVLKHMQANSESGEYIDTNSIRNEFEAIQSMPVYDDDKKRSERLVSEANAIYARYLEY